MHVPISLWLQTWQEWAVTDQLQLKEQYILWCRRREHLYPDNQDSDLCSKTLIQETINCVFLNKDPTVWSMITFQLLLKVGLKIVPGLPLIMDQLNKYSAVILTHAVRLIITRLYSQSHSLRHCSASTELTAHRRTQFVNELNWTQLNAPRFGGLYTCLSFAQNVLGPAR
jgi:hypothetical protein